MPRAPHSRLRDCSFVAQLPSNGGTAVDVDPGAAERLAEHDAAFADGGLKGLVCERAVEVKIAGEPGSWRDVQVFRLDDEFVVEFPAGSLDVEQRAVRVMCYGAVATAASPVADLDDVTRRLDEFVAQHRLSEAMVYRSRFETGIRLATDPPDEGGRSRLGHVAHGLGGVARGMIPRPHRRDDDVERPATAETSATVVPTSPTDAPVGAGERAGEVADAATLLSTIPAHERALLLVGSDADYHAIDLHKETRSLFLNDAFVFVDIATALKRLSDPIVLRLLEAGQLRPRTLLVQSPLSPDRYLTVDAIAEDLADRKIRTTAKACQLLGARSIRIHQAVRRTVAGTERWSADASVDLYGAAGGSATTVTFAAGFFRCDSAWELLGGEPDAEAAHAELVAGGMADDMVADLISLFRSGNRPTSHRLSISTESEMRRTRSLIGSVSVPFAEAQAALDDFIGTQQTYDFELEISFGA